MLIFTWCDFQLEQLYYLWYDIDKSVPACSRVNLVETVNMALLA